jgi:hypothetical protein
MNQSNRKAAWVLSVVVGLFLWYFSLDAFSWLFFKIFYPTALTSGAARPPDAIVSPPSGIALLWIFIVTPTITILVLWSCIRGIMKLAELPRQKRMAMEMEQWRAKNDADRLAANRVAQQRLAGEQAAQRAETVEKVASLVSSAQAAAARLPIILVEAEVSLDRAETEFADNVPSSFWEAMETAAMYLSDFEAIVHQIDAARMEHSRLASLLGPGTIGFSLGVYVFPGSSRTGSRMNLLYRQAQGAPDSRFAIIYEQRRLTTMLDRGFRSLAEALTTLGYRVEIALDDLSRNLGIQQGDLQSALCDSIARLGEQQIKLIDVANAARREAGTASSELAAIARKSATRAEEGARSRMKDANDTRAALAKLEELLRTNSRR